MSQHFRVITDHPVALDSRDHLKPQGTKDDNSRNPRFNHKLLSLLSQRPLRLCDVGCSGGGFVKDMLDAGQIAIGLEGSDYSLKRKRAEWATIPDHLFTCDITHPFTIVPVGDGEEGDAPRPALFDVITAWEVMEHIPEDRLPQLCRNVRLHLAPQGLWIMSVSRQQGYHHVTVHDERWWTTFFEQEGFRNRPDLVKYFDRDWIRGPHQAAPDSFHLILQHGK